MSISESTRNSRFAGSPQGCFSHAFEERVERGREADSEDGRRQHPAAGADAYAAHSASAGAAREDEREDADDEAPRRHHHRAIPEVRAAKRGVLGRRARLPLLLRELDHQYRVLRGEADQHDAAELRVDREGRPSKPQPRDLASQAYDEVFGNSDKLRGTSKANWLQNRTSCRFDHANSCLIKKS